MELGGVAAKGERARTDSRLQPLVFHSDDFRQGRGAGEGVSADSLRWAQILRGNPQPESAGTGSKKANRIQRSDSWVLLPFVFRAPILVQAQIGLIRNCLGFAGSWRNGRSVPGRVR